VDWTAAVGSFCERTGPGFWNEPFNAISSLAILLAAAWAASTAWRMRDLAAGTWLLIGLMSLNGVTAFLYHTVATGWTERADTAAFLGFVAVFGLVGMHRLFPVARTASGLLAIALGALVWWAITGDRTAPEAVFDPLNGTAQYLPALATMIGFSVITWLRGHPAASWLLDGALLFLLALTFHAIDREACTLIPIGTHWLWLTLSAAVAGLMLQMLLRVMPRTL
jgi:hypothetical protein